MYLQLQNAEIHESQKLRFFQEIYNMGQRPHYVNTLKNKNDRDAVCKICISAHSLMIEWLNEEGTSISIKMKDTVQSASLTKCCDSGPPSLHPWRI